MIPDVTLIASGHSLILYLAKNSIGLRVIEGAIRSRDSFACLRAQKQQGESYKVCDPTTDGTYDMLY